MALTAKQEAFCQYIVSGLSQTEAYRQAYDCENMEEKTITNEGHKLTKNPVIAARIAEIRNQLAEKLLFPKIERLELLKNIALQAEQDKDKISAVKLFTEMVGDNAPIKQQIEHGNEPEQRKIIFEVISASNNKTN